MSKGSESLGLWDYLKRIGMVKEGHFQLASGLHTGTYIEKYVLFPDAVATSGLCRRLAERFYRHDIDIVYGPAQGGIILTQWIAYFLQLHTGRKVEAIFAEKIGQPLAVTGQRFSIRHGWKSQITPDKRILAVEDTLTTGDSLRRAILALPSLSWPNVVAAGAFVNRGDVTAKDLGVPELQSLIDIGIPTWDLAHEECPRCAAGIPLDTIHGHAN